MAVPRFRVTERQVLMLLLVASFVGFGAAFLAVGFREHAERLQQTTQPPRIFWMPPRDDGPAALPAYLIAEYFDPSLMSLPSVHGFSRLMWQRSADPPLPPFEPPVELALLDPAVGGEVSALLTQPSLAEALQATAEKIPASLDDTVTDPLPEVASTQSVLRVDGALASREFSERPELPVFASETTGLRPTRVRLAVAPDGGVRYATLERSCGNESVDAQALEIARRLRFEPVSKPDPLALTWGVVKFYWATHN